MSLYNGQYEEVLLRSSFQKAARSRDPSSAVISLGSSVVMSFCEANGHR